MQQTDTHFSHTLGTLAPPARIWHLWSDVPTWHLWDSGLKTAKLNGPFAAGTSGTLIPDKGPLATLGRAMTRTLLAGWLLLTALRAEAQTASPMVTVRVSLLLPFTPLLTVECRTVGRLAVQGETNFVNTHGANLKYYLHAPLERGYVFLGSASVRSNFLRADQRPVVLPYAGYGYACGFGTTWVVDGRLGFGPTLNADRNSIYPVAKVGVGKRF